MKLRKIENFDRVYFHIFRKPDGEEVAVQCTKQQYDLLATPNHPAPVAQNPTWVYSGTSCGGAAHLVDTDGKEYWGDFPDNSVLVNPDKRYEAKIDGKGVIFTDEHIDIKTGEVNEKGLEKHRNTARLGPQH